MDLAFRLLHDLVALTGAAVWLATSMAVYLDARQRLERPEQALRLLAASLAVPVAAPLLYLCLRPHETRLDRREREAAHHWLEALHDVGERCLVCRTPIESTFLCCPRCSTEIRRPCEACGTPVKLHWNACPQCATSLGELMVPPREGISRAA